MMQSLSIESRLRAFIELGRVMGRAANCLLYKETGFKEDYPEFYESLQKTGYQNAWFTVSNIAFALKAWQEALKQDAVYSWATGYQPAIQSTKMKRVAAIMAGNIPLVGFHDFMCILICGHCFIGKLSSDDKILLPAIAGVLCQIEPGFAQMIQFTENSIKYFDAIIATGSNNTARYFEYYFSKYPHIIRKNRNGVAVLAGNESDEALEKLGSDLCMYFGLGCRNVSKVMIPAGYDPTRLYKAILPYEKGLSDHYKYMNNYSYHRSVYLLNTTPHLDNGVIILTESEQYSSPISVIYYQFYSSLDVVQKNLIQDQGFIQCIATDAFNSEKTVPLGTTQSPGLTDYADGIDTVKFLTEL